MGNSIMKAEALYRLCILITQVLFSQNPCMPEAVNCTVLSLGSRGELDYSATQWSNYHSVVCSLATVCVVPSTVIISRM